MSSPPLGRGTTAARILARVIDAAAWAGSRLPAPVAHALAAIGGRVEWALRPAKRSRLAVNLGHAIGASPDDSRVRRLVRREMVNEARRSADLLWALGRPGAFLSSLEVEGAHHAVRAVERGGGLLLVGTHVGGWEVATAVPATFLPVRTSVVVADNWLAWAMDRSRTVAGLDVLYPAGAPLRTLRRLQAGECLLMLGDDGRFAGRLIDVRFLDGRARLPAGLATLARLAQAPVVTFTVLPSGRRRWRVVIEPVIDPPAPDAGPDADRAVLQRVADRWSDVIRANPAHWSANHPISWLDGS